MRGSGCELGCSIYYLMVIFHRRRRDWALHNLAIYPIDPEKVNIMYESLDGGDS
jgi:hypothetical protein